MKVIYYDSIVEKLDKAIEEAKGKHRKIKTIEVSKEEYDELLRERPELTQTYGASFIAELYGRVSYKGIQIRVECQKQ